MSASNAPVETIPSIAAQDAPTEDAPFVVHLLATPRWSVVPKFQAVLNRTLATAPHVPVMVTGAAKNDSHLEVTFGISMGPESTISDWSPESIAGFDLLATLMDELADFTPRYVGEPDDARAAAALAVAPHFGLTTTLPVADLAARAA